MSGWAVSVAIAQVHWTGSMCSFTTPKLCICAVLYRVHRLCPGMQCCAMPGLAVLWCAVRMQELTGVLRRALSQQAPVREALYEGILQVGVCISSGSPCLSHTGRCHTNAHAKLPP
jgi:hypothetical protein